MDSIEDFDDSSKQLTDDLSDDETPNEGIIDGLEVKEKVSFQKEIFHLKLLPYADQLDSEADEMFDKIKYNLGRYIMLRKINNISESWLDLLKYIKMYDLRFTKEDHIAFIKVMYKFMTMPNLESGPVCGAGYTLIVLLRKNDLISPSELELPWKPLYEVCKNILLYKNHCVTLKHESPSLKFILEKVINITKVYFPANATQEILDELKPGICSFNYSTTRKAAKMFEWFLPVLMTPDRYEQGYKLWFDEFMILWKKCTMISMSCSLMHIFSDLAYNNVGYIDWEPYIPLMFTKFVQSFNLPVNYKNLPNRSGYKLPPRHIGIWIASVLGGNSSAQVYLDKFLKTIETYFHPANFGCWLQNLEELFAILANTVVVRLYRERYQKIKKNKRRWKAPTPDSHKLTDADVDAFINSMMQIVTTGIFNKRCHALFEALSFLAVIRPNIVIPAVLEKVYPILGDEIEPHKQITAFNSLIAISRPLVQGSRHIEKNYAFAEGPLYVLPLLFSSLAGIDPNDQIRCLATFRLIQIYVSMIPIVDCSKLSVDMSEDERLVCEETSRFEDFVLQLMDKVFALIESSTFESVRLESTRSNIKSQSHSRIELDLNFLFLTLLRQSSHSIFLSALSKLKSFILKSTFEIQVSGRLVGALCEVFAEVNGPETLKALLPFISERFHESIDEDDAIKAEHLNNEVLYPLLLLSRLVLTQGDVLLPYEDTVLRIIDKAIHLKSLEGNDLGCVLLTNILQALVNINPINVERNLEDPEYLYIKDWGMTEKIKAVKYYVPGEKEIAAMQRIFERYFMPAVASIEEYINTEGNSLSRDDLERTLRIISYIIKGCNGFLPVWSEPPLKIKRFVRNDIKEPTLGIKGEIKIPDGSNVRYFLVQLMSKLQEVMLTKVEDDTKSFLQLQLIWQNILFNKIDIESGLKYLKNFNTPLPVVKNQMTGCKGWFVTYVLARVFSLHNSRRQFRMCAYTETHRKVFSNVFKLSISRYPGVRIKAQDILLCSPLHYPEYYVLLIPDIIEVLQRDPTDNHEAFKGILNLLIRQRADLDSLICTRDWEFIRAIWPALAASGSSEKPSIIRLKKSVAEVIRDFFYSFNISIQMSDDCVNSAEYFWHTGTKMIKPPPSKEDMELGIKELHEHQANNLKMYNETVDELMKTLDKKNKLWCDRLISINFLTALINEEVIVPTSLVRFCLKSLIHELIHERKAAMYLLTVIIKQLKKKHPKIKIENPFYCKYSSALPIKPGSRADNVWLQYNYETRPTSQEAWDEPRYVHKISIGYYAWPRELEVYAPSFQQPKFDKSTLTEQDLEIVHFFEDQQNVDKLVGFLSLEGKKILERFNENRRVFFKGLFRNYGDVFLPCFLPHLRRLVAEKQNSSQRCAAEIIAGIVQGSKHWTYDMVERMWNELLPILQVALSNLTGETIAHWQNCVLRCCVNRDPNRLHWLFELLLDELPRDQSAEASIVQFGRIMILQSAVVPVGWKSVQLLHRMLEYLESRIDQRVFRTVRDALVTTLNYILNENLELENVSDVPNSAKFLDKYYPKFQSLLERDNAKSQGSPAKPIILSTSSNETGCTNCKNDVKSPESLETHMDSSCSLNGSSVGCTIFSVKQLSETNCRDSERENTIRLFKTFCMFMYCVVRNTSNEYLSSFYKMLPLICQLENDEKDEELSKICTQTIAALALSLHYPKHIPAALESARLVCQSDSWLSRANCLEFLQVFVFHNMSFILSNQIWIQDVQDIVIICLEDERVEVREKAAKLLGGLLHCNIISDQETLLEEFKKKARTKLSKKKRVTNDLEDSIKTVNSIKATRVRHAGVLGMCAFIRAYPYDIPKHVPPIFECLSFHLNDPEPIPSTIHKTVNEFKRTHCDGWTGLQGLADKFTEEQFAVLQDLTVPPSYYA